MIHKARKILSDQKILVAGSGLLLLAGLCWFFERNSNALEELALRKDQVLAYQLSYQSDGKGRVNLQGGAQAPSLAVPEKAIHVSINALLHLRVVAEDGNGYTLNFQLNPERWSMTIDGQELSSRPTRIEGRLQLSKQGQIGEFQMDTAAYQNYGFLLSDIWSLMEFQLPVKGGVESLAEEKSFRGKTPVRFAALKAQSGTFKLSKSYGANAEQITEGFGRYEVDRKTYLRSIAAERYRRYADAQGNRSQDTTNFQLEPAPSQNISIPSELRSYAFTETLDGRSYQKKLEESIHVSRLGTRTWYDVRQMLESVPATNQKYKTAVFMMLRSYIYLHPKELAVLLPFLIEQGYDEGATGVVAAALTDIGSPEAQGTLLQGIDAAGEDLQKKEKFIAHLALVEDITAESELAIYHLAADEEDDRVKAAAELGIGVMGRMHLEKQRVGVTKSLAFAKMKLDEAETAQEKDHALRILGNIGSPEQIPLIKPHLDAAEESTRFAAIKALRAVHDAEAYGLLRQVLAREKDQNLRAAAIESFSSEAQDLATFDYFSRQLFLERDDRMIKQIITHLVNMRRTYPAVRTLLEQFIQQCGKTDVCGFASSAVASM